MRKQVIKQYMRNPVWVFFFLKIYNYPLLFKSLCYVIWLLQKTYIRTVFAEWKESEEHSLLRRKVESEIAVSVCFCSGPLQRQQTPHTRQNGTTTKLLPRQLHAASHCQPPLLWTVFVSIYALSQFIRKVWKTLFWGEHSKSLPCELTVIVPLLYTIFGLQKIL